MKRCFTLVVALFANISFSYSMVAVSAETEKVPLVQVERKKVDYGDFERTINYPIIEAYYNFDSNDIEMVLYNIGTANIYIVDILGAVINEATIETDTYTTLTLSTALCEGSFYIIVDSDYIYAEGCVNR